MEVSRKPGGPTWFAIRFQPAIAVDRDDETDMYMYIPHTNVSKEGKVHNNNKQLGSEEEKRFIKYCNMTGNSI